MTENNLTSTTNAADTLADLAQCAASRPAHESSRQSAPSGSKAESVIKRLRGARGATVTDMMKITGWQAHSVRGFLSGTLRKKLGLNLQSEIGKDGQRRYRILPQAGG